MSKFGKLKSFPQRLWGPWYLQGHSYSAFQLCWTKWLFQYFDRTIMTKKETREVAWLPSNFFCHLRRDWNFLFRCAWDLSWYFRTTRSIRWLLGKKKQNKCSRIRDFFFWQKIQILDFSQIGTLNLYNNIFWYAESYCVIFESSIKLQFLCYIDLYQNIVFESLGYYWARSLLTYSSLSRTV